MSSSTKGGAAPYRKGANYERLVARAYRAAGWLVVRQPKSGSPFDLLALRRDGLAYHEVHLIQCKLAGRIGAAEKAALIAVSLEFQAVAILAWGTDPIKRKDLIANKDLGEVS